MKSKRVILDTNIWISFLITKDFSELDNLLANNTVSLVFSNELVEEFISVANRPKFKKYFSQSDIFEVLKLIQKKSEIVYVNSNNKICRDEKDNFLLNLAEDSNADYLISGDMDLLDLIQIKQTKIVSWKAFLNEIT